jgi:hypothetical protein
VNPGPNGWEDQSEEESEALGQLDDWEQWPEPDPMLPCEYWLLKGLHRPEAEE